MSEITLRIETASEQLLHSQYPELVRGLDSSRLTYGIVEEPVGFGPEQDLILVGLVFIWESVKAGVTWDIVRAEIQKVLGMIEPEKLRKVSVYVESSRPKRRYEIECTYKDENIELSLPDGIQIKVRQPGNRD